MLVRDFVPEGSIYGTYDIKKRLLKIVNFWCWGFRILAAYQTILISIFRQMEKMLSHLSSAEVRTYGGSLGLCSFGYSFFIVSNGVPVITFEN